MAGLGGSAATTAQQLRPLGVTLAGVGATGVAALKSVISPAVDFETQVALMAVAAGDAGVGMDVLHDAALRVGGDTRLVGVTASGAADSITGLFRAGLDAGAVFGDLNAYMAGNAELGGVLRASIDLAAASELDMASGADVVSVAMATYGLDAQNATEITDSFVRAADASVASVSELADAQRNIGPTAAAFGWTLDETNTALAILSQRGITGAEAGTALKSMMTNLMSPTAQTADTLEGLNVQLYDVQGNMQSLPTIIDDLSVALEGVSEEQRNQTVQTLAGSYGMKAMNTLLAEGSTGWQQMETQIAGAATASEIAEAKASTLQGRMEKLGGAAETGAIALGENYADELQTLTDLVTGAVDAFNDLSAPLKETASDLLLFGTVASVAAGGLILVIPQIAKTVTALAGLSALVGLPTLLSEIGVGFSLMWGGAAAGEVASLGLGAAIGSIVAPLAALAGVVLLGNTLLEGHQETILEVSGSYSDYIMMMRRAGDGSRALTEAQWNAAKAPPPISAEAVGNVKAMSEAQFRVADATLLASANMGQLNSALESAPPVVTTKIETPGLSSARLEAQALLGALNALPREKKVRIIQEYVTNRGGSGMAGGGFPSNEAGTDYVPETGLSLLHQGEAVLPRDEAADYRRGNLSGATWNGNVVVNGAGDPQAAAAAVIRALQDRGLLSRSALR